MRRIHLAFLILIITALNPLTAHSQQDTTAAPRGVKPIPFAGIRIGAPEKAAAYLGVVLSRPPDEGALAGWAVSVQPGLGGGLVGIGYMAGEHGGFGRVQLAALRTWGDPWLVGPDHTYVGVDAQLTVMLLGVSAGAFVRLPEEDEGTGALFSVAFVIGI